MSEVRVVHTVPALFGTDGVLGGAERYVLELARHMAERVPTRLVTFGDRSQVQQRDALEVRVIGTPWLVRGERFNPMSRRLFSELRWATVIHCHQQHILASSVAALFGRLTRRRVFVTDLGGGGWDISAYLSTDRWYHGHLHISQYSKRVFGHGDKPWARVILGGVDSEKFSPSPAVPRKRQALFVGRLLPHKGLDYLIEGMPSDIALEVVGPRGEERYWEDLERLARGKSVEFAHTLNDDGLVQAYRESVCIVLPSVYRTLYGNETEVPELLGQTLLEGMACETPGVTTAVASLPEVVEDGITGFVVPPNDATALGRKIQWLADYPEESRAMGVAARQRVLERFTWQAVVDRCLEAYRELR
jgi:glycosyltransferase involved in cell wall biosynthesis